jgi:hypothetical protein
MTRKLKTLLVAAMALGAFAAIASGAAAAEFHCSVEPCKVTAKPDGTGATAHHVFTVSNFSKTESMSTTCNAVTGEATMSSKTASEIAITNIVGEGCKLNGSPAELVSNGCSYVLKTTGGGTFSIICPPGKEFENHGFGGNCSYNLPSQGPVTGVFFTTVGSEVTVQMKVTGLQVNLQGECPIYGGQSLTASITTGNFKLTGETDPGGEAATLWWE